MKHANYRKYNDRSHNSSTYHKKDSTNIRVKIKIDTKKAIADYFANKTER